MPFAIETIGVLRQVYVSGVGEGAGWAAESTQRPHRRQTRDGVAGPARLGFNIPWFGARLASAK